jgi:hypothetical protein
MLKMGIFPCWQQWHRGVQFQPRPFVHKKQRQGEKGAKGLLAPDPE